MQINKDEFVKIASSHYHLSFAFTPFFLVSSHVCSLLLYRAVQDELIEAFMTFIASLLRFKAPFLKDVYVIFMLYQKISIEIIYHIFIAEPHVTTSHLICSKIFVLASV